MGRGSASLPVAKLIIGQNPAAVVDRYCLGQRNP